MTEYIPTPQFEDDIREAFNAPDIRPAFAEQLRRQLAQAAEYKPRQARRLFYLRPAWAALLAVLAALIIGTLLIGPQRVYAAVRQLFGYLPGVGIIDQSAPIRVLAERVSVTRDGVTVSVNQVTLLADETKLDYGVSGVPLSAYPKGEAVTGCIEREYLRLPDGSRLEIGAPIPTDVNEATFVMPCIFNTLPGTVPTDWELPLRFISAPPDLTVMPVIELTPTLLKESVTPEAVQTEEAGAANTVQAAVTVEKVIETEDGYILVGAFRPRPPAGTWVQVTGAPVIRDANGRKVNYFYPEDVQPAYDESMNNGGFPWAFRIKAANLTFPLTIRFSGVALTHVDPSATAEIEFDAGTDPQPGQEWQIDQTVQLGHYSLVLVSITASSRGGYSFRIRPEGGLSGASVQIAGYTPNGGGGGGGGETMTEEYTTSLSYAELPRGKLTIVFSDPVVPSEIQTWEGQWQPEIPPAFRPTPETGASSVCLDANSFQALEALPTGLDGWMLLTELNPKRQIVLSGMHGEQRQVLAEDSARGVLTLDGKRLAYPSSASSGGIAVMDLASKETTVLDGIQGGDLHWSQDGSRIAYVTAGEAYGIFVTSIAEVNPRQLSNLGYESVAGWSADGTQLYYAIPDSGGGGFMLRAVDVQTGATRDLFVLDDSSRKAPFPAVSPDGKWVAYRARDNSSLYLKGMDGGPARLILDAPATAINGIVWEKEGHLLGVSLLTSDNQDGEIILIQHDNCEIYRLPELRGELDGIYIP